MKNVQKLLFTAILKNFPTILNWCIRRFAELSRTRSRLSVPLWYTCTENITSGLSFVDSTTFSDTLHPPITSWCLHVSVFLPALTVNVCSHLLSWEKLKRLQSSVLGKAGTMTLDYQAFTKALCWVKDDIMYIHMQRALGRIYVHPCPRNLHHHLDCPL